MIRRAPASARPPATRRAAARGWRVLVVDDTPYLWRVANVDRRAQHEGLRVRACHAIRRDGTLRPIGPMLTLATKVVGPPGCPDCQFGLERRSLTPGEIASHIRAARQLGWSPTSREPLVLDVPRVTPLPIAPGAP